MSRFTWVSHLSMGEASPNGEVPRSAKPGHWCSLEWTKNDKNFEFAMLALVYLPDKTSRFVDFIQKVENT